MQIALEPGRIEEMEIRAESLLSLLPWLVNSTARMAGTAWNCSANRCTRSDALLGFAVRVNPVTAWRDRSVRVSRRKQPLTNQSY
jgi:hypothetical protein